MQNAFARIISNVIYNVYGKVRAYSRTHPHDEVIVAAAAKGIVYEESADVERGVKWVAARRAALLLTKQAIIHGNLTIPLQKIQNADIVQFNSFLSKGMVLRISTADGQQHQFGMTYDESWLNQSVLKTTKSEEKIKSSLFSIIVRIILVVYILREIIIRFTK